MEGEGVAAGFLEVGNNGVDVVVNHPDLKPDADGVGHLHFTPEQARSFAAKLVENAQVLEDAAAKKRFASASSGKYGQKHRGQFPPSGR